MSVLLSRLDLTDSEAVKDCEAELRRAQGGGDGPLARWAARWGDAVVARLHDAEPALEAFDPCG